ncbi:basic leucine zipper 43-like [Impatiens glandulifera]|uniref:basic leucine zipper 43-like n=1 Tax=Impatiens glandulifera TaxID=253017 RepID=UPI001FB0F090|nr:basic leucine zipper 43-like [Impatiens glandulifera]
MQPNFASDFGLSQNNASSIQFNRFISNNPFYHHLQVDHDFNSPDEVDELQISLINERKQRRMISNRESARRSHMRKQKHLDELRSQVVWLRNENQQLLDKLNQMSEIHSNVAQENSQLKEEISELRQMLTDMQLTWPSPKS